MKEMSDEVAKKYHDPDVRGRIEWAAVQIFAESEFHQVKLHEVAKKACCSLQTLYRYYDGDKISRKEALLNSCINHGLELLAERMIEHLNGIDNLKDRLSKVFWVVLDFFDRNPYVGKMMINSAYLGRSGNDATLAQKHLTQLFIREIEEGQRLGLLNNEVESMLLLDIFYGSLLRIAQMHISRGLPGAMADNHSILFRMMWRALTSD